MSDEQLVATVRAIYQTQDARAQIPTCRFCGAIFTTQEIEAIQNDEHVAFFLAGTQDVACTRVHDCQHIEPSRNS